MQIVTKINILQHKNFYTLKILNIKNFEHQTFSTSKFFHVEMLHVEERRVEMNEELGNGFRYWAFGHSGILAFWQPT